MVRTAKFAYVLFKYRWEAARSRASPRLAQYLVIGAYLLPSLYQAGAYIMTSIINKVRLLAASQAGSAVSCS